MDLKFDDQQPNLRLDRGVHRSWAVWAEGGASGHWFVCTDEEAFQPLKKTTPAILGSACG